MDEQDTIVAGPTPLLNPPMKKTDVQNTNSEANHSFLADKHAIYVNITAPVTT